MRRRERDTARPRGLSRGCGDVDRRNVVPSEAAKAPCSPVFSQTVSPAWMPLPNWPACTTASSVCHGLAMLPSPLAEPAARVHVELYASCLAATSRSTVASEKCARIVWEIDMREIGARCRKEGAKVPDWHHTRRYVQRSDNVVGPGLAE